MKYEYKLLRFGEISYPIEDRLNDMGKDGWELVAIKDWSMYFKRRRTFLNIKNWFTLPANEKEKD
jgi:hypothetical protein